MPLGMQISYNASMSRACTVNTNFMVTVQNGFLLLVSNTGFVNAEVPRRKDKIRVLVEPTFAYTNIVFQACGHWFSHAGQAEQKGKKNSQYVSQTDIEIVNIRPVDKCWLIVPIKCKGEFKPSSSLNNILLKVKT